MGKTHQNAQCDHKVEGGEILRTVRRAHSKLPALDSRRADFGLFKALLSGVQWERALEGRGAQGCWLVFKDHFLHAQTRCIPTRRQSGKNASSRPPWMDKELLSKLRAKKEAFRRWKGGQVALEEWSKIVQRDRGYS